MIYYYQHTESKICVQKVGERMAKKDIAKQVVTTSGGIARTADFLAVGLSKSDVCALNNEGYLERIRHGYYKLANNNDISEEQLLATLIPEGIVCMESALFHYGYSDFSPRVWTLAVPRTISRPKLKIDAIRFMPYFIPKGYYEIGKTAAKFNGITLAIYDRERTICDCFKHRAKLDNETFNKAIHAYVADDKKNLSNLSKYAKKIGLFKKVNELIKARLFWQGLKIKPWRAAEVINCACSSFVRKNSSAEFRSQNMQIIWCSRADCSSIR